MKNLARLLAAASACVAQAAANPRQTAPVDLAEAPYGPDAPPEIHRGAAAAAAAAAVRRAVDASPSGYTPSSSSCPDPPPKIRSGSSLGPDEKEWLPRRRKETIPYIRSLIKRLNIDGFDSEKYLGSVTYNSTALPNIGIAMSGGGYRAMLGGAGAAAAWDARSAGSQENGNLGGLLQSATYISGLSGGDWLVGTLYVNNFTSVQGAVDAPLIWNLANSIFKGPDQYSVRGYYTNVFNEVESKSRAGYNVSATDYWGRMLSYQIVNASNGGPGYTWSSIANDADFSAGRAPMPFLLANGRTPKTVIDSTNSTVYEFTPWELGSSDPTLAGWAPLRYIGTGFYKGEVTDEDSCVTGFDNAGFVMGTTSSIYTQSISVLHEDNTRFIPSDVPSFAIDTASSIIASLADSSYDIAEWSPNPFRGFNPGANPGANLSRLSIVDGGEDAQNIPFHPHLHPDRGVDVVFAYDASSDTEYGWPDGSALIASYERSLQPGFADVAPFPVVPGRNTIRNLGLNTRPAFFGCNATNFTAHGAAAVPPLVVWLPNHPYVYFGNLTTFTWAVRDDERAALVDNGWAVATQLNATRDTEWPACVACAILARSFYRTNTSAPDACARCYDRYCWKGNLNTTFDTSPFDPTYYGKPIAVSDGSGLVRASHPALQGLVALLCVVMAFVL